MRRTGLEDRCTAVLDLIPNFDERQIRPETGWERILYPALKDFLLDAAKNEPRLRLALDAHLTLSFAAGSVRSRPMLFVEVINFVSVRPNAPSGPA